MKKKFATLPTVILLAAMSSCTNDIVIEDQYYENYTVAFIKEFGLIDPEHTWGFTFPVESRTIVTEGNQWRDKWWSPQDVTQSEHDLVMAYVGHLVSDITTVALDQDEFHNFFVTHVGASGKKYTEIPSSDLFDGGRKMDYLYIAETAALAAQDISAWNHVNDFNAANNADWSGHMLVTALTEAEAAGMTQDQIDAATSAHGAYDFAYHNSYDSKFYPRYVIVPGSAIDASLSNYHYLCFDYIVYNADSSSQTEFTVSYTEDGEAKELIVSLDGVYTMADMDITDTYYKGTVPTAESILDANGITLDTYADATVSIKRYINAKVVESDNIYDDWVIRLTGGAQRKDDGTPPPVYAGGSNRWKRIFVEDLAAIAGYNIASGSSDWDFNDIVFDAEINETTGKATVTLQALGGTLPVYLGDGEGHYTDELHFLMGYSTNQTINTGLGLTHAPVAVPMTYKDGESTVDMTFDPNDYRSIRVYLDYEGVRSELIAETGGAPAKIAARITDTWPSERQYVTSHWPQFANWVKDQTFTNWTVTTTTSNE